MRGIIRATIVLAFKSVIRIYCRISSKYLAIENVAKDVVEGSRIGLGVELGAENHWMECFSCSFILLSIEEKARDVEVIEDAIEARSLQEYLQP